MPDTAAERARRSRRHKAGDHSLCRPESCAHAPAPAPDDGPPGEIETALVSYLAGHELPDDDPRALVAAVAAKCAQALDRKATASMARELRGCLADFAELAPDDQQNRDAAAKRLLADLRKLT